MTHPIRVGAVLSLLFIATLNAESPPEMTPKRTDVKPFEYVEANVPFYPASAVWGKTGDPIKKMQKPLEPAESMKHMVTPVGFEVRLFASEPQLGGKPIAMNWDERGRLWVAVTVDYPNDKQPEGQGHDRIVICEDTDGDGRADKFTVFADKLSIPTGLIFANGGVIVNQAPHTLFLKDTDGDDVADERKLLFTGWSTSDTHAGPSNLSYGLDNWIYGIVGYAGFNGTIGEEKHSFRQGFYRFRITPPPAGERRGRRGGDEGRVKCEFLRNTNNNSWGVGFSEEGVLFGSTANGNPSVHMPIPNRYYEAVRGWSSTQLAGIAGDAPIHPITDRVRQVDHHGHFTAGAGHALYTARSYPREYWNRTAFVAEPTGHLIATFTMQADGASYQSRNAWNLLASDDEWTAPTVAEVGPDGQVWIIDWYNYIVQHNPTPAGFKTGKGNAYQTELRDKKHGRIYRLVYTGAKPAKPFSLKDATPEQLVATLKNDNLFWRRHAQRLLVERGKPDVVPALVELVKDPRVDQIGLNAGAIHALWTLHGLGKLDSSDDRALAAATAALKHASAGVRRNAVQVLPHTEATVAAVKDARLLEDPDPQVRLAAFLALAEVPNSPTAAELVARALDDERVLNDRWLVDAATSAAAASDLAFLKTLAGRKLAKAPHPALLALTERVAEHYARGKAADSVASILEGLPGAHEQIAAALVVGLARGWPKDRPATLNEPTEKILVELLPKLPISARSSLVTLGTRWGSKALEKHVAEIATTLLAQVRNAKETSPNRLAAAAQLIEFRAADAGAARQVIAIVTPRTPPELATGLIDAIRRSEAPETGKSLVEQLPGLTPAVRSAALRALFDRAEWTAALLDAIDQGAVQLADLSLDQKQRLASHRDLSIAARAKKLLARGGGLPSANRQKVIDELAPLTKKTGDAAAGKAVFKNQCAKCHTHSGEGEKIGPDLTGMNVHSKAELLVHIMDPSRDVEGNFRQYVVTTRAGRVLTGLLASETKTAVEIFDVEAKRHTVLREDIDEIQTSNKSLMPEGFEKQIPANDLVNLLEFLTQRGKYLPLPLAKGATAISTRGMFHSEEAGAERLIFPDWSPRVFEGVPFVLVDPRGERVPNVILLNSPEGKIAARMPKSAKVPCNAPARSIHLLSGVSGWGFPGGSKGSVSMIVRLHYADGQTEDHELKNGEHFADYIRRVDVPGSKFAFALRSQQIRYLAVTPKRQETIQEIEFVKGPDRSAPLVMAVTVEIAAK
jgi:putative membrane-bound dehydrogenase-like protein